MMVSALLLIVALLYARGVCAVWRRAGMGRGIHAGQVAMFAVGLAVSAAALVSPLAHMAEGLFTAHMIEHMALTTVATPLLLLGAPLAAFAWAVPRGWSRAATAYWRRQTALRRVWFAITAPAVGWLMHLIATWIWHAPTLYELALRSEAAHLAEHASFVGTAVLLWWPISHPRTSRRAAYMTGMGTLFLTATQTGVLGALITLSGHVLYPAQSVSVARWGLTPMQDQTLAGLIMWVPGSLIYLAAMSLLFMKWLEPASPSRRERLERRRAGPLGQRIPRGAGTGTIASLCVLLVTANLAACTRADTNLVPGGDVVRGREAIETFGCGACHTIPGVADARGMVGPPLEGMARRAIIGGQLANTPENMIRWIQDPQAIAPGTAMPNLGIAPETARDIAAYLSTLR